MLWSCHSFTRINSIWYSVWWSLSKKRHNAQDRHYKKNYSVEYTIIHFTISCFLMLDSRVPLLNRRSSEMELNKKLEAQPYINKCKIIRNNKSKLIPVIEKYHIIITTYSDDSWPRFTISIIGGSTFPLRFFKGGGFHKDPSWNIRNSSTFHVSGESP